MGRFYQSQAVAANRSDPDVLRGCRHLR